MTVQAAAAPIVHTGANPVVVNISDVLDASIDWCELLIHNLAPISLIVTIGGDTHPLGPGMANVFPLKGQTSFRVAPTVTPSLPPGIVPSDTYEFLIAAASTGDSIPGTYPALAGILDTFNLGTLIIPTNVSPNALDVARPPGINYLRLNVTAGDCLSLQVSGDQTGLIYLSIQEPGAGSWFAGVASCLVTEAADSSITVSAVVAAGHHATILVSGYPTEAAAPVVPRVLINSAQQVTQASTSGQPVIGGVPDVSGFQVGSIVRVIAAGGAGQGLIYYVKAVSPATFSAPSSLTLTGNLTTALAIGDVVQLVANPAVVARKRIADIAAKSQPGAGVKASLTVAASPGFFIELETAKGDIVSVVAAADGATFLIGYGARANVYQEVSGTLAQIGSSWQGGFQGGCLVDGAAGLGVFVGFAAAPQNAANQQSVQMIGYLAPLVEAA